MLALTMMSDHDTASQFKATIHILVVFSRIIVLIIRIQLNSKDPLFSRAVVVKAN